MVESEEKQKSNTQVAEGASLSNLVLQNRKRTFRMFANDLDTPVAEDPSLIKMKIKFKLNEGYSRLGKTPGVLSDHIARKKILKDLGHAP